ncbi:pre-mRNA processing factor 3-domain-containing protein [Chytridium lagenaria]|nr:pre-mRNA processing factor 3-domain-containing protein [Chytridium lagenaria]
MYFSSLSIADSSQVAALIAQKRAEIAAKMAALRQTTGSTTTAAPSTSTPSSTSSRRPTDSSNELQSRISEVKSRIQAMKGGMSANPTPTPRPVVPPPTEKPRKAGLKMEANRRAPDKATMTAAAAAAATALEKVKKVKEAADAALAEQAMVEEPKKELLLVEPPPELFDAAKNPYFDPSIPMKVSLPKSRVAGKSFKFIQKGKYVDQANKLRQQALLEKLKADIAATVKKAGMEVELDLVSDLSVRREPPPSVEWWDAPIVGSEGSYDEFDLSNVAEGFITNLKERKKLRRQRRQEAQKETQDKIRLGLLPPEQPKLKISNLMRVLGTEAVQDPTKIEAIVRAQMKQRQLKQQKYLAENKLTKEQRRERKKLKLMENTHVCLEVAVFRVSELGDPRKRFKVEANAVQLNLSGIVIVYPAFDQYKKLMLRREEAEDEADVKEKKPNECALVWEGKIHRRMFQGFKVRQCATEREVKDVLEKSGALNFWDAARHYVTPSVF